MAQGSSTGAAPGPALAALIFDVDGTLAETEELHRQAYNETFAAAGLGWHWSRDDYHWLHRTTGGKERMRHYRDSRGDNAPSVAEIAAIYARKTLRYGDLVAGGGLTLRPGVRELVAAARAAGLRLGVATTTGNPNVDALCLACWGQPAAEIFDAVVAGDDVPNKKPAPDAYLRVLELLGVPAEAAIAFEDSRNGLVSALGAGLRVVVTPSIYTGGEDFTGAACVLPDLTAEALPGSLGLPL
ncbi:MAG: HAD-IA family hydrolase [Maritimibacter sp.]|nr:HAD-IA family hydrolase [Maritimibacter sp.]